MTQQEMKLNVLIVEDVFVVDVVVIIGDTVGISVGLNPTAGNLRHWELSHLLA